MDLSLPASLAQFINSPAFADVLITSRIHDNSQSIKQSIEQTIHTSSVSILTNSPLINPIAKVGHSPSLQSLNQHNNHSPNPFYPSINQSINQISDLSLDEDECTFAHGVVLTGRTKFFHRLLTHSSINQLSTAQNAQSASQSNEPFQIFIPELCNQPILQVVPPDQPIDHLPNSASSQRMTTINMLCHQHAVYIMMKYFYTNVLDLSSINQTSGQSITTEQIDSFLSTDSLSKQSNNQPFASFSACFTRSALSCKPFQSNHQSINQSINNDTNYRTIVGLHLLLFGFLMDWDPSTNKSENQLNHQSSKLSVKRSSGLYRKLTNRFTEDEPVLYSKHVSMIQSIKQSLSDQEINQMYHQTINNSYDQSGIQLISSSQSFLDMNLLRFGAHHAARGVLVRVPRSIHQSSNPAINQISDQTNDKWVDFKVDPLLLACRSGFFQSMFSAEWRENHSTSQTAVHSNTRSNDQQSATNGLDDDQSSEQSTSSNSHQIVLETIDDQQFRQLLNFFYTDSLQAIDPITETTFQSGTALPIHVQAALNDSAINQFASLDQTAHQSICLLCFSVLYELPALSDQIQQILIDRFLNDRVIDRSIMWLWRLCENPFFERDDQSNNQTINQLIDQSVDRSSSPTVSLHRADSTDSLQRYLSPDLEQSINSSVGTSLTLLQSACVHYATKHFIEIADQSIHLDWSISLIKQCLDSGTIACDSDRLIHYVNQWINYQVQLENLANNQPNNQANNQSIEQRRYELAQQLLPPATLFNTTEKQKVLGLIDQAFLRRLGLIH